VDEYALEALGNGAARLRARRDQMAGDWRFTGA
jgi:hypothetical protein